MKYQEWEALAMDWLDGNLTDLQREQFEHATEENPEWQAELDGISEMLDLISLDSDENLPGPLSQDILKIPELLNHRRSIYPALFRSAALIAVGLIMGLLISYFGTGQNAGELSRLQSKMTELRNEVSVAMLDQNSASARLKGIRMLSVLNNPNSDLIEALIRRMKTDPNVNVRLSAVNALFLFRDRELVHESLIGSLENETSPLVQAAIIDLLVKIQESDAIEALQKLANDRKINNYIRKKAKNSIKKMS